MNAPETQLRRSLSFWPLLFYSLGIIVGAGIYVAIGDVIARAGDAAPFSFLLAGIAALATGLCYAELAGRFPEAAGAAAYVRHSFGLDWLAQLVGAAVTLAGAVSAASIAHGAIAHLLVILPLPPLLMTGLLIIVFTAVAAVGVRESVWLAAILGVVEIAGLVAATGAGFAGTTSFDWRGMVPTDWMAAQGTAAGAFIAFFAFIGFETVTNLAEEVKEARRTVPRCIIGAVVTSVLLYVVVAIAVVQSDAGGGAAALAGLFEGNGLSVFAAIAFLAIANGVLVEIVMLARLYYGMARNGELPAALAIVHPRTRTPVIATILAGTIVLAAALLISFESLLVIADLLTLIVFALVDLALWRVKASGPAPAAGAYAAPRWLPPVAALLALVLMAAEFLR